MSRLHEMYGIMRKLESFEDVQEEFAGFGACDTGPEGVWHMVIRAALFGKAYPEYETPDDWGLYGMVKKVETAAIALTVAAKAAHREIVACRLRFDNRTLRATDDLLKAYAWRAA